MAAAKGVSTYVRYALPNGRRTIRIVIVTQEDPFYLPLFFRTFFQLYRQSNAAHVETQPVDVRGVLIQQALGNRTRRGLAKRIWSLYGTVGFIRMGVRYAWKTALRLLGPAGPTVQGYCKRAAVPLLVFPADPQEQRSRPNDANGVKFRAFLRAESIDLVVSVSASQIFKADVLAAPPLGCINLHNAPLPRYRGMLPNFWQLYYREHESVLTIHQMVEDLDRGDVLHRERTPITSTMSLEQLIRTTKIRSAHALWDLLLRIVDTGVRTEPLSNEPGSYHTWPTREQARTLRRSGRKLL